MNRTQRAAKWLGLTLLAFLALGAGNAFAFILLYSNLSDGYSGCYYTDNGNGTSTVEVTIAWKRKGGHTGPPSASFVSRGVLLYTYDANGKLNTSTAVASTVKLQGQLHSDAYSGIGYVMYRGTSGPWLQEDPLTAKVTAVINNASVQQWPAIGIRAGNYTSRDDVGEIKGLAYIAPSNKNGQCHILVDPELPPPPVDVLIDMQAPDWDLGELTRGVETQKTLNEPNNRLCFTYNGGNYVIYQKYVITAANANGLSPNGAYQLQHAESAAATVPYRLTLDDGRNTVPLPNPNNMAFNLNSSGKTCFVPTFSASAPKDAKGGAYSDVLTFTIVAKP
ncbi:hypothetical protein RE432_00600 [Pusillimonas sp. SM2304]|uniref:hypothetical protein n=1 Tax=Pusillimonas sp. SM2304 TaxID=3073241 RepID=UPI0028768949|nr:hypothetical protein [Pusillimonas sp. SM2304]MDS1138916.1 hypothetical protein [Pusillimonas sp. SM2304]